MQHIDTDYLVVGAGAAGLAFTDELIANSDVDVVMVDRRTVPGGHWNDAYPFVRLHQPSAFYGVNSRPLGTDQIVTDGPEAGFYERATGAEICDYFRAVLDEQLLASGQVRFFGGHSYEGATAGVHRFVAIDGADEYEVTVRRKLVDATYLETPIPKTHTPSFTVASGARLVPVNDLVAQTESFAKYVLIGAGKTSMDACTWLLDNGVEPERIQWIRPRDPWVLDRSRFQPLDQVASVMESVAIDLESGASATSIDDMFERLERAGRVVRIDEHVTPTMYRCAILSRAELAQLRQVADVVRLGRVQRIETDQIVLEQGSIPTAPDHLHVDCTAAGLRVAPAKPMFEPDRITLQQIRYCSPTFNAALVGYVEATRDDLDEQNRLCPPNPYPDTTADWIPNLLITMHAADQWSGEPDLQDWMGRSRLNLLRDMNHHLNEPRMREALTRYLANHQPGLAKLQELATAAT